MSILLSAINRSKQSQQLSGKIANISSLIGHIKNHSWPYKAISAVSLSVLLGGIAAWLLNTLLIQHTLPTHKSVVIQAQKPASTIEKDNALASNAITQQVDYQAETDSANVRMAGKVPLPIAIPQPIQDRHDSVQKTKKFSNSQDSQSLILGNNNNLTQKQLAILQRETGQAVQETPKPANEIDKQQDLIAAFQQALKDVEYQHSLDKNISPTELDLIPQTTNNDLPKLDQLSKQLRQQVPDFHILAHIYATSPKDRWLNVDGKELQQGDSIDGKLEIVEIRPRDVVLKIDKTEFTVPSI